MSKQTVGSPLPLDWLQGVAALTVAALAIAWNLDAKWLVGDELNAIHYLRDGFLDYVRNFHYGLPIKAQVWAIHGLFGNDFGWYRVPAAIAAILACALLFVTRPALRPRWEFGALLAVFLLTFNGAFLYFARWGMPNYAEAIAASTLFLGLILRDLQQGPGVRWSPAKMALACLLPWLYPATIVLLGGVSLYLGLTVVPAMLQRRAPGQIARDILHASVPLVLGLVNLGINIGMRSAEDWERARGHHATFTEWAADTGGGHAGFVVDGTVALFGDLATSAIADGGYGVFATGYAALLLLAALAIVVAPGVALWVRSRNDAPPNVQSMLRALGLLATIVVSTLVVTSLVALADSFPIGSIRYVLHLFPTLAFLAIFSLACVGWAVERATPRAWAGAAWVLVATVLVLSALGIRFLAEERAATEAQEDSLLAAMRSERNIAVVSWDPGFFLPAALFPDQENFFQVGAGKRIPPGLVPLALGTAAQQASPGAPREIAFFARTGKLVDASGNVDAAAGAFADRSGYEMVRRLQAGTHEVVVFSPRPGALADRGVADGVLALPPGRILSIRIEPTELRPAAVTITRLALDTGSETIEVDLCGDRRLQLVRTTRLRRTDEGCAFRFGNEKGTGWIAPHHLRNLPASNASRRLHIAVNGDLGLQVKVYLDVGQGYGSRDMLAIDVPSTAAPSAVPDGNTRQDATPGNQ